MVVSWWSYSTTLWYGQYVEHLRPDVTVIDDSTIVQQDLGSAAEVVDSYLGKRPVFLIRTADDLPTVRVALRAYAAARRCWRTGLRGRGHEGEPWPGIGERAK